MYGPEASVAEGRTMIVCVAESYDTVAETTAPVSPFCRLTVAPDTLAASSARAKRIVGATSEATFVAKSDGDVARTQSCSRGGRLREYCRRMTRP
jgi:hypothetical protein